MTWSFMLCWLSGRHKGRVGYIQASGPFWLCDNCGEVVR